MKLREKAVMFLATGFYIGNIPFAPGSFGSLIGIPFCFALAGISLAPAILCTLLFIFLAVKKFCDPVLVLVLSGHSK